MSNRESIDTLLAVDVGNSRIKLGRFDASSDCVADAQRGLFPIAAPELPQPSETLELPISARGDFDTDQLSAWHSENLPPDVPWFVASVNRSACEKLQRYSGVKFLFLTCRDLDLSVEVDQPERVGIDRLVSALAADRVRRHGTPAIVIDHGSAITIDLLSAEGAFQGGAILPGIAMSARALADGTDALPLIDVDIIMRAPPPVGGHTQAAIESGLWWGSVGAVRELVHQIAVELEAKNSPAPQVIVTGGGGKKLASQLDCNTDLKIRHLPHLVLSGIALTGQQMDDRLP